MANIALLRKSPGHVIRIRCARIVLQMATDTRGRRQIVVSALVAISALQLQVPTRQREAALGMIERGRLPGGSAVANRAVGGKSARRMIRIGRSVVVLHVARRARRARQISAGMAIAALQLGVRAGERKSNGVVIEISGLPCRCIMAILASLRKPKPDVVGVGCFLKVRHVTTDAIRRRALVPASQVAGRAVQTGVGSRQSEAGHFQMVERGAKPGCNRVALLATGREPRRRVVGPGRLLVGCCVARVALEREPLKLADGGSLVATVALQRGMPANQWETVLVIPHRLNRNLPPLHVVAALAICTHLPVVNVGVAVTTLSAGVGKNRLGVTLRARHVLMHTQKRVGGFTVIKFRNSAYRFPSQNGVAILAGNA